MRKVAVEEAVGLPLGHDVTEIRPVEHIKHRAYRRGHVIEQQDIERLRDLGKNFVYVASDLEAGEVHEDDAARTIAPRVAGRNIEYDAEPCEGKIGFRATCDGVLRIDARRLLAINSLAIPALPTIPNNYPVTAGQGVAAFRIIPLTCPRQVVDDTLAQLAEPLLRIDPYVVDRVGILVTGSEVHAGRIEDGFIPRLTETLQQYGVAVGDTAIAPDDLDVIRDHIKDMVVGNGLVLVTGGTSVDPDDVSTAAMVAAGVEFEVKGMPVQPGNNFTIGYSGDVAVCAVPAATLFFRATALDLFLPRLLAGERIGREQIAAMGLGGLAIPGTDKCFPNSVFGLGGRL